MFDLAQLESLVHPALQLLTECIHLVLLLLHESGLSCQYLFVAILQVSLTLPLFQLVGTLLHLVSLLVVLLLGQVLLDLSQVEQLRGELECERLCLLHVESVLFNGLGMGLLELLDLPLVIFLCLLQLKVPVLVEILVALDVSSLNLFLSLLMLEDQSLVLNVELLLLKLCYPVLSHLSLYKQD